MLAAVERYYTAAVLAHGATPRGADWACGLTQDLRFVQLLKLLPRGAGPLTLNDLGCGWGALLGFLRRRRMRADYHGTDISAAMIRQAHARFPRSAARFSVGDRPPRVADAGVASGLFNVRQDAPLAAWEDLVAQTLATLWTTSRVGFAANFIDARDTRRAWPAALYTCTPQRWARHCERSFGARVRTVEGYGLGEFTLLVDRAQP